MACCTRRLWYLYRNGPSNFGRFDVYYRTIAFEHLEREGLTPYGHPVRVNDGGETFALVVDIGQDNIGEIASVACQVTETKRCIVLTVGPRTFTKRIISPDLNAVNVSLITAMEPPKRSKGSHCANCDHSQLCRGEVLPLKTCQTCAHAPCEKCNGHLYLPSYIENFIGKKLVKIDPKTKTLHFEGGIIIGESGEVDK